MKSGGFLPMGFYEEISRYYDYIFPVGRQQLDFIKAFAGDTGTSILDVACGSGGYSVALAGLGYKLTATDLETEMIIKAKAKAEAAGVQVNAFTCDMKELEKKLVGNRFGCIFCIGNSIVHLGSMGDILDVLKQMHSLLNRGGKLILQTINYDRILKSGISGLPTITNKEAGLEFTRNYKYDEKSGLLSFDTILTVTEEGTRRSYENSIDLFPVLSGDVNEVLTEAGFKKIQLYGDFEFTAYDTGSYMLVATAEK